MNSLKNNSAASSFLSRFYPFFKKNKKPDNKKMGFDYKKAQKYELNHAKKWLENNFERLYPEVVDLNKQKELIDAEFFKSKQEWERFVAHINNKICLEIGSGPAGHLIRWFWAKKRIIIDPLIDNYKKNSLKMFGKSWFTEDIKLYSLPAEKFIRNLENKIDGAIVCRNTLDHCENPVLILNNISRYAKKGCYLLLWSDLYHSQGRNEGHANISREKTFLENKLKLFGFKVHYAFVDKTRKTINYGCRAIKK